MRSGRHLAALLLFASSLAAQDWPPGLTGFSQGPIVFRTPERVTALVGDPGIVTPGLVLGHFDDDETTDIVITDGGIFDVHIQTWLGQGPGERCRRRLGRRRERSRAQPGERGPAFAPRADR